MFQHHLGNRSVRIGACVLVLLLGGSLARSQPAQAKGKQDARACAAAYKNGQEKVQSGHLVEASQLFTRCSDQACGAPLWQECTTKNTQLYSALPSVVPVVTDDSGDPRIDVQVKMDGQLIATRLDGRAVPVDPGTHEFSFINESGVFASETVTIAKGEHNRPIAVSYPTKTNGPLSSAAEK